MKWMTALLLGGLMAFLLPMFLGGNGGVWMGSMASVGTVRPFAHSPGLLFSIPLFLFAAFALRSFFEWHS
ncbi:hypothetical protein WJS89_04650 [Sphingomicrobium sp. XHP0235]|uniref:hypothetical protein n=1 Tax=Sphingomicrobium aquimarinum TaxID=3133971 RepID=UPI0031FED95C